LNKIKLNREVAAYRAGNEESLVYIFETINPLIEKASRDLENYIDEFTKFDCRVILELKRLIKTFKEDEHDFLSAAKAVIDRTKSQYYKRDSRNSKLYTSMNALETVEDEDKVGYQFADRRQNVEDEVLLNEKITLLAQGDNRRKIILTEWTKGATSKSISELLAQQLGGKADSHYRFIKRFKSECQNALAGY